MRSPCRRDVVGYDDTTNDPWFKFKPVQDCLLRADMCPTRTAFDFMIGVYYGYDDCEFPNDPCGDLMPPPSGGMCLGGDENCPGDHTGGAAVLTRNAVAGQCYWIRVGAWDSKPWPPPGPQGGSVF